MDGLQDEVDDRFVYVEPGFSLSFSTFNTKETKIKYALVNVYVQTPRKSDHRLPPNI